MFEREMWPASARDFGRRVARANAHDLLAVLQEQAAHRERLIDDAAAIVAHVEHDALGALLLELLDRGGDFVRGVLVERLQRDVADLLDRTGPVYATAGTWTTARVKCSLIGSVTPGRA